MSKFLRTRTSVIDVLRKTDKFQSSNNFSKFLCVRSCWETFVLNNLWLHLTFYGDKRIILKSLENFQLRELV